jgi:hypothetical protein
MAYTCTVFRNGGVCPTHLNPTDRCGWHCGSTGCRTHTDATQKCPGWQMAPITGSVGRGGANRYEDLRVVQGALNRFPETAGGPDPRLDTDGKIGSRTIGAIEKFQRFWFPSDAPDGRVDVGKRSHRQLQRPVTEMVLPVEEDPQKVRAREMVQYFAARTTPGAFRHLSRQQIAQELLLRIDSPSLINQGQAGLCPSAAVVYSLAVSRLFDYVKAVINLYEHGRAIIGRWTLEPGDDLKNYRLPATAQIPSADWIIMASIRDSENFIFDYQATTDRGGAWGDEVANWMRAAGYKTVLEEWNESATKDENHLRRADTLHHQRHHVILLVHVHILDGRALTRAPNHWVVLSSRVHFGQANQKKTVSMTVFTWGRRFLVPQPPVPTPLYLSDFLDCYYGFVACKF